MRSSVYLVFVCGNLYGYTTPEPFINLYHDFAGNTDPNYPKGKVNIAQTLYQSELKDETTGPLLLFINSTFYIYNNSGKQQLALLMRTAPDSGFTEMTAISHIGPALAYLAKVKLNGDASWKTEMAGLLSDIKAVQEVNQKENWLAKVNAPAWKPHLNSICRMVDYACTMSENYITGVLSGKNSFTIEELQTDFYEGGPIPYNTVMIATFMLTAFQNMTAIHDQVAKLNIDWPKAKVIIRFEAGGNVTSGLTVGSNWIVPFLKALSNNTVSDDRVYIAPYTEVRPSLNKPQLSEADYNYYNFQVWASIYNRTHIAKAVFTEIPDINLPPRPAIPGDYGYSKATDINDFLVRLKYSLAQPSEMLSNTVAFWLSGELAAKKWDLSKVDIPGLTVGLPPGVTGYPSSLP